MSDWVTIPSFPDYEANDLAEIRNIKSGRIIKQQIIENGKCVVTLRKDGRSQTVLVSRIMAETFVECDEDIRRLDALHLDGDKSNNRPDNLKWATRKESVKHAFDIGLRRPPKVTPIRIVETGEEFESIKECAKALGVSPNTIAYWLDYPGHPIKGYHFERI